jgi:hypothetical protein
MNGGEDRDASAVLNCFTALNSASEVARAGIEPATFRFSGGRDSH